MVGWSRRSAESSRRRQLWWNSLSEEEKAASRKREAEYDAKLGRFFTRAGIILVVGGTFIYGVVETYRWVIR